MTQSRQDKWGEASRDLAAFLDHAVGESGQSRRTIAAQTNINKDALRRILAGTRPATLQEALTILDACGHAPRTSLMLALAGYSQQTVDWQSSAVLQFLETFISELPAALDQALGERLLDVRPRWARGAAHRTAGLLSDHLAQLERQDEQSFAL
ncbi:hypothetical protein [Qipengyuania sp. NPDC077563]|uniref:hypothetical protein n=2 Tax=Alphaproteobacteria TaxID=28211 RepID=UPI00384CE27B